MRKSSKILITVIILLFFLFIFFGQFVKLYTDWLWFKEVGQSQIFIKTLLSKVILGLLTGLIFLIFFYLNFWLTRVLSPKYKLIQENEVFKIDKFKITKYLNWIILIVTLFITFLTSLSASKYWQVVLQYLNQVAFKEVDPIFKNNISFYVYTLPFYRFLRTYFLFFIIITFIFVLFIYVINRGVILIRRRKMVKLETRVSGAKIHLSLLGALFFILLAWSNKLSIYNLLYSKRGVVFGIGYTDVYGQIPLYQVIIYLSLLCALFLILNSFLRLWKIAAAGIILLFIVIIFGPIYPAIVLRYVVKPNELTLEKKYLEYNIQSTRKAYNLDAVEEDSYPAKEELTMDEIARNEATIKNIRLWDWRPLKTTYSQIQLLRQYYTFNDVDIDRYHINSMYQQVALSAREFDYDLLQDKAKTWINRHLKYTHGYGLAMSSVNKVSEEGQPELIIKDIPPKTPSNLEIKRPEIYYGEKTSNYILVKAKELEFDYPKGDQNVYTTYQGNGGVSIGSFWHRLLFAWKFADINLLITPSLKEESRILFHREIFDRVNTIAPFLYYDHDPYLVISEGKLYWIYDAYTITNMYPYSESFMRWGNYIRNSVKIVIDVYNGQVIFYQIDKDDPLIRTWAKIFPTLVRPFEEMNPDLKKHIRYPLDIYSIQAYAYATYHMKDPQVFYNKEDQWQIANEVYEEKTKEVEPYYMIMKLPEKSEEEFILMLPFTPANRDNMISWLSAKCDLPQYGGLIDYKFPKEKLIYGPMQIEARFNQDPEISRQMTLWGQVGSKVIRGNLMVIPIEQSLLYVSPIYLTSLQSQIPELKRVIVSQGYRIAMDETLDGALSTVFQAALKFPEEKVTKPVEEEGLTKLVTEAYQHYQQALKYLREGNWAGYGEEMKKLEEILKKLQEKTKT